LPVLFAFAGTSLLKTEKDLYLFFLTLYFSVFSIALISLVYKFFGILTFDGRLQGFYSSPNFLAMQIVPGIIWGILIYIKKYYKSSIPKKLLFISTFSALLLTLFFTYSYGAWVAFFMAMLTIYFYNHYKFNTGFKINILSGTLIIIAIFLLSQAYSPRVISYFSNNPRTSLESRIMIWKSAALMISNNPIIGIGAGNFQKIYLENQKYFPLYLEWAVPQPHNIFLAFWLQSGLLGLIGFITLLVRTLNKLYFWQKKEHRNAFVIALSIYFLYFLFHGMLDTPFWKNDLALIFWLLLFVSFTPILVSEKNHP
jgi:O-antigen ligase